MKRDRALAAALGMLFVLVVSSTASAAEDDIKGKWFNTLEVSGLPQPVWITVSHLNHGQSNSLLMQYSKPRDCRMYFQYGGNIGSEHVFYFEHGDCSYINAQRIIIKSRLSPDANLVYDLQVDGKSFEKAVLKRT